MSTEDDKLLWEQHDCVFSRLSLYQSVSKLAHWFLLSLFQCFFRDINYQAILDVPVNTAENQATQKLPASTPRKGCYLAFQFPFHHEEEEKLLEVPCVRFTVGNYMHLFRGVWMVTYRCKLASGRLELCCCCFSQEIALFGSQLQIDVLVGMCILTTWLLREKVKHWELSEADKILPFGERVLPTTVEDSVKTSREARSGVRFVH